MNVYESLRLQESTPRLRYIDVMRIGKGRREQVLAALVITLVLMSLAALVPAVAQRLSAQPAATPAPTPVPTAPPAAVLLPDERDRALDGVMTLVNDHSFGTAFLIDPQGDFVTAASLVSGSSSLRLIDNTAGMHTVSVIGIDAAEGFALVRTTVYATPLAFGNPGGLQPNDPVVLLASPKLENVASATPAVVTDPTDTALRLQVNDVPGNRGGPIVGPGATVLGVLIRTGTALPITLAEGEITAWRGQPGTPLPLAPMPANLVLRGSDSTSSTNANVSLQSVSPSRASNAQDTVVTIQGSGFVAGPALRVRFVPVASQTGAFDGLGATLISATSLTVKVPAGRVVADYVIQLVNGDGTVISSGIAFTVTS
jgi:Trypsin-like peptidase domain/IPT/TIG domain